MFDANALMGALPHTRLEPANLGIISGFKEDEPGLGGSIFILEPPARSAEPYLNPIETMTVLHRFFNMPGDEARAQAIRDGMEINVPFQLQDCFFNAEESTMRFHYAPDSDAQP